MSHVLPTSTRKWRTAVIAGTLQESSPDRRSLPTRLVHHNRRRSPGTGKLILACGNGQFVSIGRPDAEDAGFRHALRV